MFTARHWQLGLLVLLCGVLTCATASESTERRSRRNAYLDYLYSRSGRGSVSSAPTIRSSPIPRAPRRKDRMDTGVPRVGDNSPYYQYESPFTRRQPEPQPRVVEPPPPPQESPEPAPSPAPAPAEAPRPSPVAPPSGYQGAGSGSASSLGTEPPTGFEKIEVRGKSYFRKGANFYERVYYSGTVLFREVDPPTGAVVEELPGIRSTVKSGNVTYYRHRGTYYEPFTAADGSRKYRVVEEPTRAPASGDPDDPYTIFQNMVDLLRGLKRFSVTVDDTSDYHLSSGQRAQISTRSVFDVQKPDKARFEFRGKDIDRMAWYDGETISILERPKKLYTVIPMPPTVESAIDTLANDYGVIFPMIDLIRGRGYHALTKRATKVLYVGITAIEGVECHHLFFDSNLLSAQVWVATESPPLPLQVLITYKEADGPRRFLGTYSNWNLAPVFPEGHFTFEPPPDAERIEAVAKGKLRQQ